MKEQEQSHSAGAAREGGNTSTSEVQALPGIDLDLDKLEALARAATPGPWAWWTSNSFHRLTAEGGADGGVLRAYVSRGFADIRCVPSDRAFIAAANPATTLALIAQARAAQPAGELPAILFDGKAIYDEVVRVRGTSIPEAVNDTLDAIVRLMRKDGAAQAAVPAKNLSEGGD